MSTFHHHHHQSLNREGRWGTTNDFATFWLNCASTLGDPLLSIKIIKPAANRRKDQNTLSKRVIKELKNSWIDIKRSELPQQMESLVPFLCDGLGVRSQFKVSSKIIPGYLYELTVSTGSSCIWIATWAYSLSAEIHYRLFSFAYIQVKVRVITLICEIIEGHTVTILRTLKKGK